MRTIDITVTRDTSGQVLFVFDDGPQSFVTLVVVTHQGDTIWEVHPSSMQPSGDGAGAFVSVPLPHAFGTLFRGVLKSDEDLMSRFAPVAQITYGAAPAGYEATTPATTLFPNARYSVIVLRDAEYGTADFQL